jgi:hypothetical protein
MHRLAAHPGHPPLEVSGVSADLISLPGGRVLARYRVEGTGRLVVPEFRGRGRADLLWKSTCFELFLRDDGPSYREFNFSPSGQWAAYSFDAYREGMAELEPREWPDIACEQGADNFVAAVTLAAPEFAGFSRAGLNAVIEEQGGHISYWALAHPEGKPDFHDPACFALSLAAPERP